MDPRHPVDAAVRLVDRPDALGQPGVGERPLARRARRPLVVARAANAQPRTCQGDRGAGLLHRDEPVHAHRVSVSFAKKAAARLSRSRSCARRAFSRRSRRSSSRSSVSGRRRARGDRAGPAGASCAASAARRRGSQTARAAFGRHATTRSPRGGSHRDTRVGSSAQTPSFRAITAQVVRCPENRGNSNQPSAATDSRSSALPPVTIAALRPRARARARRTAGTRTAAAEPRLST